MCFHVASLEKELPGCLAFYMLSTHSWSYHSQSSPNTFVAKKHRKSQNHSTAAGVTAAADCFPLLPDCDNHGAPPVHENLWHEAQWLFHLQAPTVGTQGSGRKHWSTIVERYEALWCESCDANTWQTVTMSDSCAMLCTFCSRVDGPKISSWTMAIAFGSVQDWIFRESSRCIQWYPVTPFDSSTMSFGFCLVLQAKTLGALP